MKEKKTILIVDDNAGLRRSLSDILEAKGYQTLTVESGKKALELFQQTPVALALIDLYLPDLDGLEVMRRIKEHSEEAECIVLTGHASLASAIEAVNLGAYSYVQKPYNIDQFLLTIRRAIEKQEAARALRLSEESLSLAIEASEAGYYKYNADFSSGEFSPRWMEIFGFDPKQIPPIEQIFDWWKDRIHPEDRPLFLKANSDLIEGRSDHYGIECRIRNRLGEWRWVQAASKVVVRQSGGQAALLAGIMLDITESKKKEKKLAYMATHDALTKLPNRPLFLDRLAQALAHAERSNNLLAVMYLDLDDFKRINDSHGHEMGDLLLSNLAQRLLRCLRKSDTVGRLGGDEFVILLPDIQREENVMNVALKILQSVKAPFELNGRRFQITTSIGIAIYPADGIQARILLNNADIAMYHAKSDGKDSWMRYCEDMKFQFSSREEK